jgi:hypothetical protein
MLRIGQSAYNDVAVTESEGRKLTSNSERQRRHGSQSGPRLDRKKFIADFPKALRSYIAEPLIPFILKDEARGKGCAALLWPCINGSSAGYVALSAKWTARWDSRLQDAITGAEAEIDIFTNMINDPSRVKDAQNRLRDYVETQEMRKALPAKKLGTNQDWTIVQHTKESLESLLCKSLSLGTLAALLNAAFTASGRSDRTCSADSIGRALRRLRSRIS